jgi:peptide/nickel transport system substrate-binding protein
MMRAIFNTRYMWVVMAMTLVMAFAVACSGSDDGDVADAPAAAPTWISDPPTVVPPSTAPPKKEAAAPKAEAKDAAPAAAAASGDGPRRGGHLRVLNGGFPPKWDFSQTSTWLSLFHYGARAYSGLLQFSPRDGVEIWPDMAKTWEVSNDSKTFTFFIDENITQWHDGQEFSIEDIIYALERWKAPPEGIIQPRVGAFTLIDSMTAIDDHTLEINLTEPFGDFVAEAANQWHQLLPQHILEANEGTIPNFQSLIGTGPYTIVDAEDGISVEMDKWEDYWRLAPDGDPFPYLDKVTSVTIIEPQALLAALAAQNADATKPTFNASHMEYNDIINKNPGKASFEVGPFVDVASIQLNNTQAPFNNIDARKAVFYGFFKQGVIDANGAENPLYPISWFSYLLPPTSELVNTIPGYQEDKRDAELAKAQEHAEAAGLTAFESIAVTARTTHGELLQADMAEIGIDVSIRVQDWTAMIASVEGRRYEAATGGTAPSYGGIVPLADIMYSPAGGRNGGWDPPDNYIAAWNEARTMGATPARNDLFVEMHRIMAEEWVPSVPYAAANQNKFKWNYVQGWDLVVQEIFSNNKFETEWLTCEAPEAGAGC